MIPTKGRNAALIGYIEKNTTRKSNYYPAFISPMLQETMLRITPSKSADGAINYFTAGLSKADYYATGEHPCIGTWHGQAAERLELEGTVTQHDFAQLCRNRIPGSDHKLNPRDSNTRKVGYDFTFSTPKSVSLLYALTQDERIAEAFQRSVHDTMDELEQEMRTQTGQGRNKHHPVTNNLLYAVFIHLTTRPVDGTPDPHLHAHCYAMNTTWYGDKERFQAGEFGRIVKQAPYYEAAFDARLAYHLTQLGYAIETRGYSFEIAGIDDSLLQRFSRRTAQIEALAAEETAQYGFMTAKQKSQLGALTRDSKRPGQTIDSLREHWLNRLSKSEWDQLLQLNTPSPTPQTEDTRIEQAVQALEQALAKQVQRHARIGTIPLLTAGLKESYGKTLPAAMHQALELAHQWGWFYHLPKTQGLQLTTDAALQEERKMIRFVREGRGRYAPLHPSYQPQNRELNSTERAAITHVLQASDQVILLAGVRNATHATPLAEIRHAIESVGKRLVAFQATKASTAEDATEHNEPPYALEQLWQDPTLQEQIRDQVIWVDAAGLIGNRTMNQLFAVAQSEQARILLTGDRQQHSKTQTGDALRILQERSGIQVAQIGHTTFIKPNAHYQQVVDLVADDKAALALAKLDRMGGIKEITDSEKRVAALVKDYLNAVQEDKTALIIPQTPEEGQNVTQMIRSQLKALNLLSSEEQAILQLQPVVQNRAQSSEAPYYPIGHVIHLQQHVPGGRKGEQWQIIGSEPDTLRLQQDTGRELSLPLIYASRFAVYAPTTLSIAVGERIRLTQSGTTLEGKRVHRGDLFTVTGFSESGDLLLSHGKQLARNYGLLDYGYTCPWSAASGKSVQRLFIVPSEQVMHQESSFYQAVMRGRELAKIYTDNKLALEQAIYQWEQHLTPTQANARLHRKKTHTKYENNLQLHDQSEKLYHHGTSGQNITQ